MPSAVDAVPSALKRALALVSGTCEHTTCVVPRIPCMLSHSPPCATIRRWHSSPTIVAARAVSETDEDDDDEDEDEDEDEDDEERSSTP